MDFLPGVWQMFRGGAQNTCLLTPERDTVRDQSNDCTNVHFDETVRILLELLTVVLVKG